MSAVLAWLGIWSLSAGWLLLVDFFLPPDGRGWALVAAGVLLLVLSVRHVRCGVPSGVPLPRRCGGAPGRPRRWHRFDPWLYLLAVPLAAAALIWPFPHRAGPLLLLGGLVLALPLLLVSDGRLRFVTWLTPFCLGLGLAGAVWIAQSGAAVAYWWLGSRIHEATFLTPVVYALTRLLGWTAGSSAGTLFLPNIEEMVQATTTWERLGAFPAMLLGAGGLVLLPLIRPAGTRRLVLRLAAAMALGCGFLLVRYLVLTAALAITRNPAIFWLPLPMALTFLPLGLLLGSTLCLRTGQAHRLRSGTPQGTPQPTT
jgi:hypothetical protein